MNHKNELDPLWVERLRKTLQKDRTVNLGPESARVFAELITGDFSKEVNTNKSASIVCKTAQRVGRMEGEMSKRKLMEIAQEVSEAAKGAPPSPSDLMTAKLILCGAFDTAFPEEINVARGRRIN